MAYTFTCAGVVDEITGLTDVDDFHIQVTFKVHGSHKVSSIMNREVFASLKKMHVGQKVLVATNGGDLMWVDPE